MGRAAQGARPACMAESRCHRRLVMMDGRHRCPPGRYAPPNRLFILAAPGEDLAGLRGRTGRAIRPIAGFPPDAQSQVRPADPI